MGKASTAIPPNLSHAHGHHANTSGFVSAEGIQCHTAATGNLSSPPSNMLLPSMYYLLCSAVTDGLITTFVACMAPKLAATPMYPIYSRSAYRTLSVSAGIVFTLFHLLERIVGQRVSITLMSSAIKRSTKCNLLCANTRLHMEKFTGRLPSMADGVYVRPQ